MQRKGRDDEECRGEGTVWKDLIGGAETEEMEEAEVGCGSRGRRGRGLQEETHVDLRLFVLPLPLVRLCAPPGPLRVLPSLAHIPGAATRVLRRRNVRRGSTKECSGDVHYSVRRDQA